MTQVTILEQASRIIQSLGEQWEVVAKAVQAAQKALQDEDAYIELLAEQFGYGDDWGVRYDAMGERG